MQYSNFVRVDQIKGEKDLTEFMAQVDNTARASKYRHGKPVFGNMEHVKDAAAAIWRKLTGNPRTAKMENPNIRHIAEGERSKNFAEAQKRDSTVIVTIFVKGKPQIARVYRDNNGKWRDHLGRRRKCYMEV